ncbi:unnamed protein product [Closterium sp. NIES-53]
MVSERCQLHWEARNVEKCSSNPAAVHTLRPAALCLVPCCSPRVALSCPARRALQPCTARALLPCPPRALPCSPRRALPCPAAPPSPSRPAQPEPRRPTSITNPTEPPYLDHQPHRAALPRSPTPPSRPAATTAAAAARATAAAAARATAAGSVGSAAGTGGARGAAGAGGAGPTIDRHCLSWPLSRQLQRLGVDSGGHCLSQTTPPLSSFASGFFSEPILVVEALRCVTGSVEAAALSASDSAAALGASESTAALGASEAAAALGASESAATPDASECAAALGARASPATGPSSAEALHTFTLDSGASRCFFRDFTTLTPLAAPVPVSLADPTGGPVVARTSTVLPCPADPSGSPSGLHLPMFSTNLVSNAAIQDVWVDTFIPGGQRVAICQVAASSQVSASGQLVASCSCRVISHQTLLWHHRLGHPSLPHLRSMHSCLLVSDLPTSLPSLLRSPSPSCLPRVEGRQRAAPHSSKFPPTTAPLQTLYMGIWGPSPVVGTDQERYFLLSPAARAVSSGLPSPASALLSHWLDHGETSPTLRWTGKVGDPSVFQVWGVLSLVRNAKASKLSSRTLRCVFLGFPTDAPVIDFASTCRLDYATSLVAAPPASPLAVGGEVKRPPGSPPVFKARYVARGFRQREVVDFFQTFAPTLKMTTLRLHRPSTFTGTFPPGTQWRLRRPDYGLHQAPCDWHDTLRSTLSDLGFQPSSADSSLFVRRGSTPFLVLVYVDDLVFATADRVALADVKREVQKRHTCTDLSELRHYLGLQITTDRATRTMTLSQSHMVQQVLQRFELQHSTVQGTPLAVDHRLTGPFPNEPFDPSGPYAELVGCLMYLMTCTRPDLAFPLSILARFVALGRHRPVHWISAVRVAKYLATTSGVGLVLGGTQSVVLTGHCDSSYENRDRFS